MRHDSQSMERECVVGNPGQGKCPGASARNCYAQFCRIDRSNNGLIKR